MTSCYVSYLVVMLDSLHNIRISIFNVHIMSSISAHALISCWIWLIQKQTIQIWEMIWKGLSGRWEMIPGFSLTWFLVLTSCYLTSCRFIKDLTHIYGKQLEWKWKCYICIRRELGKGRKRVWMKALTQANGWLIFLQVAR